MKQKKWTLRTSAWTEPVNITNQGGCSSRLLRCGQGGALPLHVDKVFWRPACASFLLRGKGSTWFEEVQFGVLRVVLDLVFFVEEVLFGNDEVTRLAG